MKFRNAIIIFVVLLSFMIVPVMAEPWAKTVPFEVIKDFGSVSIPNGAKPVTQEITFPALTSKADKRVVLKFQSRIHGDSPGGWNYYLGMNLNGKLLSTYTANGTPRIVNRQADITLDEGRPYTWPWWNAVGGNEIALLTFFGPGGTNLDSRIKSDRDELYYFMVDITDIVNYIVLARDDMTASNETNILKLTNNVLFQFVKNEPNNIVVDDFALGYINVNDWKAKVGSASNDIKPLQKTSATIKANGFTLNIGAKGQAQIVRNGEIFELGSTFSESENSLSFNAFSAFISKTQNPGWKPSIKQISKTKIQVVAKCGQYTAARTYTLKDKKILVTDKITNLTNDAVGVMIEHSASAAKPFKQCLLGGVPEQITKSRTENPTMFIEGEKSNLGIFAQDNVFRLQLTMVVQPSKALMKVDHFGLDAKKSYTFEWSIYPMAKSDNYWAFINQVRKDIGINYTIQGPWTFFHVQYQDYIINNPERLKEYLKRKNLKIIALSPWIEYENMDKYTGQLVDRKQYKEMMIKAAKAIKDADPNVWVTGSMESFPFSLSLEDSQKLFDRLPSNLQLQGYPQVDPNIFDGLKGITPDIKKALVTSPEGKNTVEIYNRGKWMASLFAYAEPGNAMQKLLLDQAKYIIKDCGLDGIYIDSYNMACDGYMDHTRFTYEKWDGNTVDMDSTSGKIIRKYTDVELSGAPARKELIDYVLKNSKVFVSNGYSPTKDAQNLPAFRFSESEYNFNPLQIGKGEEPPLFYRLCASHLSSPLGLGYRPERLRPDDTANYAKIIMKTVITYLRHGALFYHYTTEIPVEGPGSGEYGPINNMYPITPIEINEGFIIGKERIISARSMQTTWQKNGKPEVMVFDITGRQISGEGKYTIIKTKDGWNIKLNLEDWEEIAVVK